MAHQAPDQGEDDQHYAADDHDDEWATRQLGTAIIIMVTMRMVTTPVMQMRDR